MRIDRKWSHVRDIRYGNALSSTLTIILTQFCSSIPTVNQLNMVDHQEQTKWTALPTDEIPETAVTSEEESVERLEKSKPRAHYVARNHHQDDSSASPPKFLYLMHAISILAVAMAVLLSLSLSFTKRFLIIRRDLARLNMPYGNPVPRSIYFFKA